MIFKTSAQSALQAVVSLSSISKARSRLLVVGELGDFVQADEVRLTNGVQRDNDASHARLIRRRSNF